MKSNFDRLKKMAEAAQKISDQRNQAVPLTELMPSNFIADCSNFKDLQELFDSSKFNIKSRKDFTAIPDEEWDKYIRENTTYSSWIEMQKAAVGAWTKRQLGL